MTVGAVRAIPEAPALGFSVTTNLDGNRQLVVQSFVPLDMAPADMDRTIDIVMRRVDRQRAYYEFEEVEAEHSKLVQTLAQFTEDRARLDTDHERGQALRKVELDERRAHRPAARTQVEGAIDTQVLGMIAQKAKERADGEEEYRSTGRLGSYTPSGYRKRNIELIDDQMDVVKGLKVKAIEEFEAQYDAGIATAEAEIAKSEVQRVADAQNLDINMKRYGVAIEESGAKLSRIKKILEG